MKINYQSCLEIYLINHHAFTSTSIKINPSLPPKKKRTVVFRKSSYRSLKWLKKKIKQMHGDYHIQVHTIRLKTQFVWLRREYSTQYEACLVEKKTCTEM